MAYFEEAGSDTPGRDPDLVPLHPDFAHQSKNHGQKRNLDDFKDWDIHGGYMDIKQRKLRNQFEGMGVDKKSTIFEGVSIYVNGWTQPNKEELKEMIYAHGGKYEYNVYSRSVVTHTIASNLPNSKILKLGSSIVCKPSWIVDSIAQNVLLPVDKYLLYKPQDGQAKLGFPRSTAISSACSNTDNITERESNRMDSDDYGTAATSTLDPSKGKEFVNEFFTHSRLHYLSTWSTELKQFTAEMLREVTPRQPKLPISASVKGLGTRAVVHVDLDCFFVSVSIRNQPHLKDKPVAVTHAKLPKAGAKLSNLSEDPIHVAGANIQVLPDPSTLNSTSDIASCSYKARDAGVTNGMSVGTALKKCPGLILLPYDFKSYREVSQAFYEILLHYSAVIEAVSCDEAYIELTEYCRDFDHVSQVVQELRNEVQIKTGCTVSAGISHNMLLARMCTRVAKPDGQFYLPAREADGFFNSRSVRDLPGVGYSIAIKLKEMGIENCVDLRSTSLGKLQSQFGAKTGRMLHEYARGMDSRELKTSTDRKSVSVDINFGIRLKVISEAEVLLGSISQELQKRAEQARVFGNQLTLKMKIRKQDAPVEPKKFLGHGACDNVSRSLALLQPSRDATECGRLAVKLLKQLNPVATDIRGVGLQLSKLLSADGRSGGAGTKSSVADLRDMLKGSMETEASVKMEPTRSLLSKARPDSNPFIESTRRTPQKTALRGKRLSTKRSPGKLLKKASPAKSPGKGLPKSLAKSSSKSLKNFFANSEEKVDDSFRIDLPPASQLDVSVLAALPSSMCQKILEGYASKEGLVVPKKEDNNPAMERSDAPVQVDRNVGVVTKPAPCVTKHNPMTSTLDRKWRASRKDEIVVGDERVFLSSWKKYVTKLCISSCDGPASGDCERTADYLSKLAGTNLEMAELCLKNLRRFLELQFLVPAWVSAFNMILEQVQKKVTEFYGGVLKL